MSLGEGVGRGALIGAAVGFVFVGGVIAVVGRVAGLEPLDSLGVAAVAAVWGGPGFGVMFGAITTITRNERAALAVVENAPRVEASP